MLRAVNHPAIVGVGTACNTDTAGDGRSSTLASALSRPPLRAGGLAIADADLAHVWPLQRRHVVPSGVYFVNRTMPAFTLPEPVES